jgi:hypothetical protein
MARPKESRRKARAGTQPIVIGVIVGHRIVVIRDGKFMRPGRRKGQR